MDVNQSSCSSEEPTSQQVQQEETDFLGSTLQKTRVNSREMVVNSDSLINETRHSIKMSENSDQTTSLGGSSSMINEKNSSMDNKGEVAWHSEDSYMDDSSNSYEGDFINPLNTTTLQDDSVVEFSLDSEKSQDEKDVMEVVLAHTGDSGQEKILQSQPEEQHETPPHTSESKDEAQQIHAKSVEEGTSETSPISVAKEQSNSIHFQNEIRSLLSATSALCSSSSNLEVGRTDFSSTPKENLMRMLSDLLDECDWLKKEKAR